MEIRKCEKWIFHEDLKAFLRVSESLSLLEAAVQRCSIKKVVLRNFTKFTGKHLCQSLLFNKVAGLQLY